VKGALRLSHIESPRGCESIVEYTENMADLDSIIKQLEEERSRIDAALAALKGIKSPSKTAISKPSVKPSRGRRRISAEGRARIAAAQKKRWAAVKKK
jgi:hypothetical protein